MEHAQIKFIYTHDACMYLYPCASGYPDERIADAGPPHTRAHVLRPCASACAIGRPRMRARSVQARSVAVDRGWLGAQAFQYASAFNADIGAWNTASITLLANVCAAFPARAARHRRRDVLGGTSMRRGQWCAAATTMPARARAQPCGPAHARVCTCVGIAARRKTGYMYVCMYVCM